MLLCLSVLQVCSGSDEGLAAVRVAVRAGETFCRKNQPVGKAAV